MAKKIYSDGDVPFAPPHWPASTVQMWKMDRIKPYPNNPRSHPPEQILLLAADMKLDGVTMPILVDEDGVIIAGHGRLLAAQANGFEVYPVVVARGWSETQKRAVRLKDNQTALLSGWDAELVKLEVGDLKLAGYDIGMLHFPEAQLRAFGVVMGTEGPDPEVVPEPPKKPIVRRGDLWMLGDHRLLCGDSTNAGDVAAVLAGARPNLSVTDPPYGVEYDPSWRADANKWRGSVVKFGAKAMGRVHNDTQADWQKTWELFPGNVIYSWSSSLYARQAADGLEAAGFILRCQIIWDKQRLVIGRGDYHWQHEPCWYAVRKGKPGNWQGARDQTTVWSIPKPQASESGHGTQKPIECMKRPIENNSKAGDFVYEPFAGSGTTIIAAEMTGRKCLAIELDLGYVQVAIERWQTFTKREATLDGKTFAEVAAARRKGKPRAQGHSGITVPKRNGRGNGAQSGVRQGVHARRAPAGRKPAGQSPAVAGDS